jgi:hypothetical protein
MDESFPTPVTESDWTRNINVCGIRIPPSVSKRKIPCGVFHDIELIY